MKKIISKPCELCGEPVFGRKRADREAYHYPKRCVKCFGQTNPNRPDGRVNTLNRIRRNFPIGTRRTEKSGYVKIKIGEPNEWIYEHRLVMNAPDGWLVHHRDENRSNNDPSNLELIKELEHQRIHHALADDVWSQHYSACIECGETSRPHASRGRCTRCNQRHDARIKGHWPKRS